MDFEKLADASHHAWFLAMARQGWVFGPRLSAEFKTHPWLKPYPGLNDNVKEIVRAQVRGLLHALEAQGVTDVKGLAGQVPAAAPPPPRPAVVEVAPRPAPPAPPAPVPQAPPAVVAKAPESPASDAEIVERRVDASGRMRIGSGLVKKADLLKGGAAQVTIVQNGPAIEVLPYDPAVPGAFAASVNPDGFMLPKAMLAGTGAQDFILTITPGRLVVRPK